MLLALGDVFEVGKKEIMFLFKNIIIHGSATRINTQNAFGIGAEIDTYL
jgi:hypothetical protein